ncbi:DNA methylase [anaerobic digester metagenome]
MKNKKEYVLTKEILDSLRSIDGFPIGKDEDIIALSDPPFYTACPNPWIGEFIETYGTPYDPNDGYNREPFSADVSEGKNDPIYNAHSYHTKVPHKAIMRYILHYTKPGDIVFDGFCGTGMTGVAAQMCGCPDPEFKDKIEHEMPGVEWGARRAILCDLSPAATFIAYNYNNPVDPDEFEREAKRILEEVEAECGWMYETRHVIDGVPQVKRNIDGTEEPVIGKINFTVWSDIFICSNCSNQIVFSEVAIDKNTQKVKDEFSCPSCGTICSKRTLEREITSIYDHSLQKTVNIARHKPFSINYSIINNKGKEEKFEKKVELDDLKIIEIIDNTDIIQWYPITELPNGVNTEQPKVSHGITHVHHFYFKRPLVVLSKLFEIVHKSNNIISKYIRFNFEQAILGMSKLNRYSPTHFSQVNRYLNGTLYIGSQQSEVSLSYIMKGKINRLYSVLKSQISFPESIIFTTQSSTNLSNMADNSIDYIFTDPPFGGNLMYSELNFLWESWFKVHTHNSKEAIENSAQNKAIFDYQKLMEDCFTSNYRILKPGRWMTVEFHNTQNYVWVAIQEALQRAGFIVSDVRTLDKQQRTFKAVTTTSAMKQDLIISSYKPSTALEQTFTLTAGTEEGVWAFIEEHLRHLPVVVEKEGIIETIAERQNYLLFDRMVAFHVQRGITVPISSAEFYAGLAQRYPERDSMYFLPEQVEGYESARLQAHDVGQLSIFVHDERSAVQWLRQELATAQTYQEIQPAFLRQLHQDSHEALPELSDVLEENFLKDDQGKWYVPNPSKASDLEKIRERSLLREFGTYVQGKGKLKLFRSEAVRAGFAKAWKERDYGTIVSVGKRLPPKVLQEDDQLLMYFDNAVMRGGE